MTARYLHGNDILFYRYECVAGFVIRLVISALSLRDSSWKTQMGKNNKNTFFLSNVFYSSPKTSFAFISLFLQFNLVRHFTGVCNMHIFK